MNYKEQLNSYKILFNTTLRLINQISSNDHEYNKKYKKIIRLSKLIIKKYKGVSIQYCINEIENLINYIRKTAKRINTLNSKDLIKDIHKSIYKEMDLVISNIENFEKYVIENNK